MNKAFTLLELLVVVAIMGLLGTVSVGGYRQMQRGMEQRGVIQNVNTFLSAAFQRAQIDRMPVAVFFWNETLKEENEENFDSLVVVGHAVAVRQYGRVSCYESGLLIDEFGDLEQYMVDASGKVSYDDQGSESTIRLYRLGGDVKKREYSNVKTMPQMQNQLPIAYIGHEPRENSPNGKPGEVLSDSKEKEGNLVLFGYKIVDKNGVNWANGTAYGFEFESIDLPHGWAFGTGKDDYSERVEEPIKDISTVIMYWPGNIDNPPVPVSQFRLNASGAMELQKVDTAQVPQDDINTGM